MDSSSLASAYSISVKDIRQFGIGLLTYYREKGETPPMSGIKIICHPSVREAIKEEERDKRYREFAVKALARCRRRRERRRERGEPEDSASDDDHDSIYSYDSGYDLTSGYDINSASAYESEYENDPAPDKSISDYDDTQVTASRTRQLRDAQESESKRPRLSKFNLELQIEATTKAPRDDQTPSVGSTSSNSTGIPGFWELDHDEAVISLQQFPGAGMTAPDRESRKTGL